MKVVILGAAGFIGTNLALSAAEQNLYILAIDEKLSYFNLEVSRSENISRIALPFSSDVDYSAFLNEGDLVFHLACHSMPATSNRHLLPDFIDDVGPTIRFLDACVKAKVAKVIFSSSGGTVYGKATRYPIAESSPTNPINSYGVQKLAIEKLFPIYHQTFGLDYVIARISNPYGPYQRPNGSLGVVTNFVHNALSTGKMVVYGDGTVVRDFIYIDDLVQMLMKLAFSKTVHHIYNIGTGIGTSINEVTKIISSYAAKPTQIQYIEGRPVDVPTNYLDISRYESEFGRPKFVSLREGIHKTFAFFRCNNQNN